MMPVSNHLLDIDTDFRAVVASLRRLRSQWKVVGTYLGVSCSILEKIEAEDHEIDNRILKLASSWLKKESSPNQSTPTWRELHNAFAEVGSVNEAERIAKEHFCNCQDCQALLKDAQKDTTANSRSHMTDSTEPQCGVPVQAIEVNSHNLDCEQPLYKMLVIGETGSGKTSFLNLLYNHSLIHTHGFDDGMEMLHSFHKHEFELSSGKMESKTNNATLYRINAHGHNCGPIGVIDTPGFGDSRGLDEDKKHVKKIIAKLKDEFYVNCVCFIINGRISRLSGSLKYILTEVTAILPKTVMDNLIVVFTNTATKFHLTFKLSELTKYVGFKVEHSYCIENPYCFYERAREESACDLSMLREELKAEFEKTARVIDQMFNEIKKFEQVHTNDFMMLYQKKKEIECAVLLLLLEYNNQNELEKKISEEEQKLKAVIHRKFSVHRSFEQDIENIKPVPTAQQNTLCGYPGCYSNCHLNCNIDKSLSREVLKNCPTFKNGETCQKCGHSYRTHYHNGFRFKRENVRIIDHTAKQKYDVAKSEEEKARITKTELESQRKACELEKKRLLQQLTTEIREFETLKLGNHSYLALLENQFHLIELYLKLTESGNEEHLKRTVVDLQKQIAVVKESKNLSHENVE